MKGLFLLLLAVLLFQGTLVSQVNVLTIYVDQFGSDGTFPCVQDAAAGDANFTDCPISLGVNNPIPACATDLSPYDLVLVQSIYSSIDAAFIAHLISYMQSGGSVYFMNDVGSVNWANRAQQEQNINDLLAGIGQTPITLSRDLDDYILDVPVMGGTVLPNCPFTPESVNYKNGGFMTGASLSNATTWSVSGGTNYAFWPTGYGGVLGIGTEFYSSGNDLDECTTGSGELIWSFMNPTSIDITVSGTNIGCGGLPGSVAVTVTGGTPNYTYDWSNLSPVGPTSATTDSQTGLTAGTYSITVTDAEGCYATGEYTITSSASISITDAQADWTCGNSDGSITIIGVTNGTGPYDIDWNPGANANNQSMPYTISGLLADSYNISITDATGCTTTENVTLTENAYPTGTVTSNTPVCSANDAIFTITGTPNATVTYNIDGGPVQTIVLDASGNGVITEPGVTVNTTINLLSVANSGGAPSTTTGNGLSAVGGIDPGNATGAILPAGTALNGTNSAHIRDTGPTLTLTLEHTVPAGTVITIAICRMTNGGDVDITDGTNTQTFNAGPNGNSQYITFTTGQATNTLTFSRNGGRVRLDGVEYSFSTSSTSCSSTLGISEVVVVNVCGACDSNVGVWD